MQKAFLDFNGSDRLHILDVGNGNSSTMEFLAPLGGRVFFLDLEDGATADGFAERLAEYRESLFDVCLFWDLLHYLEPDALIRLNDALRPYVYSRTKGYSVCDLAAAISQTRYRYQIAAANELELVATDPYPMRPWSYTEFAQSFDSFRIAEDRLDGSGAIELLLHAD